MGARLLRNRQLVAFKTRHFNGIDHKERSSRIRQQIYRNEVARIADKFGQAKHRSGLGRIMCKLARTSESAILLTFLVMNLDRWLKAILFWLFCHIKVQPQHSSQMEKFGGN